MKPIYDSCHHKDTTYGDDFGGTGTCREFREEDIWPGNRKEVKDADEPQHIQPERSSSIQVGEDISLID